MTDINRLIVNSVPINQDSNTLITIPDNAFTWEDYNTLIEDTESALYKLTANVEDCDLAGEQAISTSNEILNPLEKSVTDLNSTLGSYQVQADILSAQKIPMTGGSYTHLITENFSTNAVRDTVSEFSKQPLTFSEPGSSGNTGCPSRPALTVDTIRQTLTLKKETESIAFSGLPGQERSRGGKISIERIYGLPLLETSDTNFILPLGSKIPLARINTQVLPPWIPASYEVGSCLQFHVQLNNPTTCTELKLRGTLNLPSTLLETVSAVDSSTGSVLSGIRIPTRSISTNGTFSSGSLTPWTAVSGTATSFTAAPGRTVESDRALVISGLVYQTVPVIGNRHYILRYRASAPPAGGIMGPSPAATYLRIFYYSSATPNVGYDSPLSSEIIRDSYPAQGGSFSGWKQYTKLIKAPLGTNAVVIFIGTDPFSASISLPIPGAIVYSDVFLCDEAITRGYHTDIPGTLSSNLSGPGVPGGVGSVIEEDSSDSVSISLGNTSGNFLVTDLWITLGQEIPEISPVGKYELNDRLGKLPEEKSVEPYSLITPADNAHGRSLRDPFLLYQARYTGEGQFAYKDSSKILGKVPHQVIYNLSKTWAQNGIWKSLLEKKGQRDVRPEPWWHKSNKRVLGKDYDFPKDYSAISDAEAQIARRRKKPLAQINRLLFHRDSTSNLIPDSLYVYSIGLSSLDILRREFAPSGIYVTQPLGQIDNNGAVLGEIREIAISTDPPLSTLPSVRFWIIPESNNDISSPLLSRAVPLDSSQPRATFHSNLESLPGILPAVSNNSKVLGAPDPSFFLSPSLYSQQVLQGLDPDTAIDGVLLDYTPYINKEAVWKVVAAISSGSGSNPNVYDPNALQPIIGDVTSSAQGDSITNLNFSIGNLAQVPLFYTSSGASILYPGSTGYVLNLQIIDPTGATVSSTGTGLSGSWYADFTPHTIGRYNLLSTLVSVGTTTVNAVYNTSFLASLNTGITVNNIRRVGGYRPVEITLRFKGGQRALPDSLGKPRPGEILFTSEGEILIEATDMSYTQAPSSGAALTGSAQTSTLIQKKSYYVRNKPIVSGPNGAGITLWWHQSQEYNPSSGGILTRFDEKIPPSDYIIDAERGLVTITGIAPHNYAAYDQVIAYYYYPVGDIAPNEYFPPRDINALYEPLTGSAPVNGPLTPVQSITGYSQSQEMLINSDFRQGSYSWHFFDSHPNGQTSIHVGDAGTVGGFNGHIPVSFCASNSHIDQAVPYQGAGNYQFGIWLGTNNRTDGNYNEVQKGFSVVLSLINRAGTTVETQKFKFYSVPPGQRSGTDLPVLKGDGWINYGPGIATPPPWYNPPMSFGPSWLSYYPTLRQGSTQNFFQWPSYAYTSLTGSSGSGIIGSVRADGTTPLGIIDNVTEYAVTYGPSPEVPAVVQVPFQTQALLTDGYTINVELLSTDGNAQHSEDNVSIAQTNLNYLKPVLTPSCPANYTYDPVRNLCVYTPGVSPSNGIATIPSNISDLLKDPVQQGYPVTRNITNYAGTKAASLRKANLDPLSTDYYPVFEYRVDPGNRVRFADDFSAIGPYPNTDIYINYDYLDINPRIVVEILPDGQTNSQAEGISPQISNLPKTEAVEINSICFLINARS